MTSTISISGLEAGVYLSKLKPRIKLNGVKLALELQPSKAVWCITNTIEVAVKHVNTNGPRGAEY